MEFLKDIAIITAGVLCIMFWIVVIILASVEIFDRVTGSDSKPAISEEDDF